MNALESKPYAIPPSIGDNSADFILDSYLMHQRGIQCGHCHTIYTWSETFEVLAHRTRCGISGLRRLVPAKTIQPGFPIGISKLPLRHTPICDRCADEFMSTASQIPARIESEANWAAMLKRKYAKDEPRVVPPRSSPSVEDL